jgi:hypothetical protein
MDGQLGPAQKQAVESALVSDPHLAEKLRRLTVLSNLVAGLSRDLSVDVVPQVMDRIQKKLRSPTRLAGSRAFPWAAAPRRLVQVAGMLGIAAGLVVAMVLTISQAIRIRGHRDAGHEPRETVALLKVSPTTSTTIPELGAPEQQPISSRSIVSEGAPGELVAGDPSHRDSGGKQEEPRTSNGVEHVRDYLDNPNLRRIFLVTDTGDGTAQHKVASVVEQTTRLDFYKITICQGIVIDPHHPDEATVFALVVQPGELESFQERLRTALKDRVEETPVDPRVVTQLAEIDQVQTCPPAPLAKVVIPREGMMAVKFGPGPANPAAPARPRAQARRDRPTPEQEYSSPLAALAPSSPTVDRRRPPMGRPVEKPDQAIVVLVWVCRARSG